MSGENTPCHHGGETSEDGSGQYPNETIRLLLERASLRDYSDRPITPEVQQWILTAGLRSATGGNLQPYSILAVQEAGPRETLAELCGQPFMARAPLHLLFLIDWHRMERWARLEQAPFTATSSFRHFWIAFQDVMIAAQNICTAADALGLGSVYIGTVIEFIPTLREMFALPNAVFPVVLLCLGYPKSLPKPRAKLPAEVMVHHERYRDPSDDELVAAFRKKYENIRVEATEERLQTYERVCRGAQGEDFARAALARVREQGHFNAVQRYFGLHYRADEMPRDNDRYLQTVEEFGFGWFRKWESPEDPKQE
jgi:nitroreductase